MNATATSPAERTWLEVIALLVAANDAGLRDAQSRPQDLNSAWGAGITAAGAIALLPDATARQSISIEPAVKALTVAELIRAAELATRAHPIEDFPQGATDIIIEICQLVAEVRP